MIGRTIGSYRITARLGSGGMGAVFRAVDQAVDRDVAIKVVRVDSLTPGTPGTHPLERFRAEARTMAKLNHPAIAALYAFHAEGEECFLVMEYVPGKNLAQIIESRGALGWREACDILLRVLGGLQHAHAQGVIHRDLKPANILLSYDGAVKITDFGIALMPQSPRLTQEQGVIGTLEYIAPERLQGKDASPSSDLYSAGVVLYEALTGRVPFHEAASYQLILAQVEQLPASLSQLHITVPPPIEQLLMSALAKDPAGRPSSAGDFARKLRAAMLESGATPSMEGPAFPLEWLASKETSVIAQATPGAKETVVIPAPAAPAKNTVVRTLPSPAAKETSVLESPLPSPAPPQQNRSVIYPVGGAAALVLVIAGYFLLREPASPAPESPGQAAVGSVNPAPQPKSAAPAPQAESVAPAPEPPPVTPPAPEPQPVTPPAPSPEPTVASLADVKTVFVRPAPGKFEEILADQIEDKLNGAITVTNSQSSADAVFTIVFQDEKGTSLRDPSGDLEKLKGTIIATATLRARVGGKTLWSAEVNDKRGLVGGFGSNVRRMGSRLAEKLRDARK